MVVADSASERANALWLDATLVERDAIRYTPAGIPIVSAKLRHASRQCEVDGEREVELELAAMFPGRLARSAEGLSLGTALRMRGFLAPRRKASKSLVLHVTEFEIIEV